MARVRYEIDARLEVLSPLHIGTGEGRRVASVRGAEGDNEGAEVAAIVRDAGGDPYIPPTSLKGLLRNRANAAFGREDARVGRLFGDFETGTAGAAQVRGASRLASGNAAKLPFVDETPLAQGGLGAGVFVAARTSIDPAKGIAEDHTLYHAEMVVPGAVFGLRLVVEARGEGAADRAEGAARDLVVVLGQLARQDGAALGGGSTDGGGRVRVVADSVRLVRRSLVASGEMDSQDAGQLWRDRHDLADPAQEEVVRLMLVADGPYLVADASRKPTGRQQADRRRPQLAAQRTADDRPLVLGSGVSGALRAKARWLSALAGRVPTNDPSGLDRLSPEQRLFGTTGFKGLLTIEVACANKPALWTAASVKIDRFTGGPVQNALFHTEAFVGTRLALALRLELRVGKKGKPTDADRALFQQLVEDIRDNGLMLGHGVNRGYGWFRAEAA